MSPLKGFFWGAIRSASRSKNVLRHIFVVIHQNARFTLKALNQFFANIFGKKLNKSLISAPSVLMNKYKNVYNLKNMKIRYKYNKALKPLN